MTTPNPISPKKLLRSKWTAVTPRDKEKHFMVVKLWEALEAGQEVCDIEIEAVHSKRSSTIAWRALRDATLWRQGWL